MTTRAFARPLELRLPYDRGLDVLAVQQRLRALNLADRHARWYLRSANRRGHAQFPDRQQPDPDRYLR